MIAYFEAPGQEKERPLLAGGSLGHESQLLSDITRSKPNFPPFLNTLILDYPDSRTMASDFSNRFLQHFWKKVGSYEPSSANLIILATFTSQPENMYQIQILLCQERNLEINLGDF